MKKLFALFLAAAIFPLTAEVAALRIVPNKIVYPLNENGSFEITLVNRGKSHSSGTFRLSEFWNIESKRKLGEFPFLLEPGETKTVSVPYNSGKEHYGREVRCEVIQNGKTVSSRSEFFNVTDQWWRVNQGIGYQVNHKSRLQKHLLDYYGIPERKTSYTEYPSLKWLKGYPELGPFLDYGTNCTRWLMQKSSVGGNKVASDMPPEQNWYNITGSIRRTGDIIRDSDESHKRGVHHTMFTIYNMEGPYGFELGRRHPERILRNERGGFEGFYAKADPVRLAELEKPYKSWNYLTPDFSAPGVLEWAVDDLIAGMLKQKSDGVYFDGRYCSSGGYDYTGAPIKNLKELVPQQLRYVRERLRAVNPNWYIWSNGVNRESPEAEMFNDPQSGALQEIQVNFIINPNASINNWRGLMDSYLNTRNLFRLPGKDPRFNTDLIHTGYFGIWMKPHEEEKFYREARECYTFANHLMSIVAANALHPYGAGQPQYRSIRQLMTRYSEFFWHEEISILKNAYKMFYVDSLREVWWEDTVYSRTTPEYTDYYIHLVNTPVSERADLFAAKEPPPLDDVEVSAKFLKNPGKVRAWTISPYGYLAEKLEPVKTEVIPKMVDGEMVFSVPIFHYYTLMIIRVSKKENIK